MEIKTSVYINLILLTLLFGFTLINMSTIVTETSADGVDTTQIFHQDLLLWHEMSTSAEGNEEYNQKLNEDKLQFIDPPNNVTLEIGSSHAMHCRTSKSNATIFWIKEKKVLTGDSPMPGLMLFRNKTLLIKKLDVHLSGIYSCIAILNNEEITMKIHIGVRNKPEEIRACDIVLSKTPMDSIFIEEEFANLGCLTRDSKVQISWEKNGVPVYETKRITIMKSGILFISNVKLEDSGKYACVARDLRTGCTKKKFANLKINPRQKVETICGKIKAKEPEEQTDRARLISGHIAKKGSHPWQALVKVLEDKFCGGVILNHRWIATAAHCFNYQIKRKFRWSQMKVILGEHDRFIQEGQELVTYIAHFSSVVIHPNFNSSSLSHDIALIRLKDIIQFTDYILPICLGGREFGEYVFKSGLHDSSKVVLGIVSGWGYTEERGIESRLLMEISVPIVDRNRCKKSVEKYYKMGDNTFCAGYGTAGSPDACQGDSGGPFVVQHDGKWYLIGLVSGGIGCARENHYGLYTKVPAYTEWIKVIISS